MQILSVSIIFLNFELIFMSQGPLSDALNTASGITGDLLRIAKNLGATDQRRTLKANSVYGQPGF